MHLHFFIFNLIHIGLNDHHHHFHHLSYHHYRYHEIPFFLKPHYLLILSMLFYFTIWIPIVWKTFIAFVGNCLTTVLHPIHRGTAYPFDTRRKCNILASIIRIETTHQLICGNVYTWCT